MQGTRNPEPKIAPWAFGCDACQDVCPRSTKAKDAAISEFVPRAARFPPDLRSWIAMRGPEYRATYGDTALSRPGRRIVALNDASALVRDQAAQCQ